MYRWLNDLSQKFLDKDYLLPGQTVDERVDIICNRAEEILQKPGFAARLKENFQKGWYSFSTPIWINFGNSRGLPISCFGSHVSDSMESIMDTLSEVAIMTKYGGGTSAYFGEVRSRGSDITDNGKSSGAVHFMQMYNSGINVVSQGCYDDQTEILTSLGWMRFAEASKVKNIKIAQVEEDETVTFVNPVEFYEYHVDEDLILFKDSKNIDLLVTKNHNMVFKREKKCIIDQKYYRSIGNKFYSQSAETCPLHRDIKYLHSANLPSGPGLSIKERLYIAIQADGHVSKEYPYYVKFRFSKQRKVDRMHYLLKEYGIDYKFKHCISDNTFTFYIKFDHNVPKTFDWVNIENKSVEWCSEFIEEVSYWDSNINNSEGINYSSVIKINADKVQEIASVCGYKSYLILDMRENSPNKSPIYKLSLSYGHYFGVEKLKKITVPYKGMVYCVEVPSHKIIVRRNGRTVVCGNSARRGSCAVYLPIDHGDIEEFLQIKTEGNPIQDLSFGVIISDEWMNSMIEGDKKKRKIWAKVLERRQNVGYPYIFFSDNANNATVDTYKDKNLRINHSNLCTEIFLPNHTDESFVCDLSSMNILYYDEWKDTDAVEILVYLLDAVMTEFIQKASKIKHMERAVKFAERHRALGLGWLGWHSYLQSKMIPFESMEAKHHNVMIAKNIYDAAYAASAKLAQEYGEPELLKGYGRRNTTLLAIAPTKSSSWILGQVSEGIEPYKSNYYIKDLAKGKFSIKNPYLEKLLIEKKQNNKEVWNSILANHGSVQRLEFLSDFEKSVFKTFQEISPMEIIIQAAQRQKYIDQGQSLNLMIHPSVPTKDVNALIIEAWKMGIKSLYYQFSVNAAQEFSKSILTCSNCEA